MKSGPTLSTLSTLCCDCRRVHSVSLVQVLHCDLAWFFGKGRSSKCLYNWMKTSDTLVFYWLQVISVLRTMLSAWDRDLDYEKASWCSQHDVYKIARSNCKILILLEKLVLFCYLSKSVYFKRSLPVFPEPKTVISLWIYIAKLNYLKNKMRWLCIIKL